ncbi:26S proteasome regulatory subunit N5 [Nematocida sp. LUAm3]|nr:26S proteasome regulatory subunit N5 [Nematocida sp. LUAm3]KAI5175637.1 26S proteasome regulatory subunit N5 [Nematocida sp. LUAm2]KAI5178543.1 26S proteasome regulatory subunit N5 [Nematocida sp. LUAm1]
MDELFEREKKARLNGEVEESERILQEIAEVSFQESPEMVIERIRLMGRRKGQIKTAFQKMVLYSYNRIIRESGYEIVPYSYRENYMVDISVAYTKKEQPKEVEHKNIELLYSLLSDVIEGKIYLEEVRVLITDAIKQIYLKENNIRKALDIIYPVNVETFSSLSVREMIQYQLEQMRLAVLANDQDKATALSKRISLRQLQEVSDLRPIYLNRMIFVHLGEKDYFRVSEIYRELTKKDEETSSASSSASYCIFFAVLSLFHPEAKMLLRQSTTSKLCSNPARIVGEMFLSQHLISPHVLYDALQEMEIDNLLVNHHIDAVNKSILYHNIWVVSSYYSRIRISRMSEIFQMPEKEIIFHLTQMIEEKRITSHIDQITGTVSFSSEQNHLEDWSLGVNSCLDLIIKIAHLITKTES